MNVLLFPGQGSQYAGIATIINEKKLFLAQEILQDDSFAETIIKGTEETLRDTYYSQLSIFLASVSKLEQFSENIDYALGHSLGEYTALYACGVFSFEDAVKVIQKRAILMKKNLKGSMWAVITQESIKEFLHNSLVIANFNSKEQYILSGLEEDFLIFKENIAHLKARIIPLKVAGAFHSPFMKEASQEFENFLINQTFNSLQIPYVSNVTAKIYHHLDKKEFIDLLTKQLYSSVLWCQSILNFDESHHFIEIGPSTVLTNLMKKIYPEAISYSYEGVL